jgi:hypothetical protein
MWIITLLAGRMSVAINLQIEGTLYGDGPALIHGNVISERVAAQSVVKQNG